MIEAYSINVDVTEGTGTNGSPIPFNNVTIEKGCTARLSSPSTIQLNKCGVYMVSFDGSVEASGDTGDIIVQMAKNSVLQPQAQSTASPATGAAFVPLGFTTFVQVSENNSCRCCDSPTTLQILNLGEAATFKSCNVCISKIC